MANILTDLIVPLGSQYIAQRYGPQLPVPINNPMIPDWIERGAGAIGIGDGVPVEGQVIPAGQNPYQGMVFNPNANCGAGKWMKRTRRRRKRLATPSDLKDLAALKGVLGSGQTFNTWIATRGFN